MIASPHGALALTLIMLAGPLHSASIDLSGKVTDLTGKALAGVRVSLAEDGTTANTNSDGTWSIISTPTGLVTPDRSKITTVTKHLELDGKRIRLRFEGVDAVGRRSNTSRAQAGPSRIATSMDASRAAANFVDTLIFSWNDRILTRLGISSLVAGNLGSLVLDTSISGSSSAIPWNNSFAYGTITDSRDGQVYRTVKIGTQTWMAQNLNYRGPSLVGSCYKNSLDSCSKYGRIYTWSEVMNGSKSSQSIPSGVKGICPKGFHVPSDAEWITLKQHVDPTGANTGRLLRSTAGWLRPNDGKDSFGFRVIPSGLHFTDVWVNYVEWIATFWTATEISPTRTTWSHRFDYDRATVMRNNDDHIFGSSLRCVEDVDTVGSPESWNPAASYGAVKDSRDGQVYRTVTIGRQTWMAENLNYRNTTGSNDTVGLCYNHELKACSTYGRLYTWSEVMAGASASKSRPSGVRGICPADWHIPSDSEWTSLQGFVDWTKITAGVNLKSTWGWSGSGNGPDPYGFRVLPAGAHGTDGFTGLSTKTTFWTSAEANSLYAFSTVFESNTELISRFTTYKTIGSSIRCVRDSP